MTKATEIEGGTFPEVFRSAGRDSAVALFAGLLILRVGFDVHRAIEERYYPEAPVISPAPISE